MLPPPLVDRPKRRTRRVDVGGMMTTWEGRLGDDDRVTLRLLDADAFIAQKAARNKSNWARIELQRRERATPK